MSNTPSDLCPSSGIAGDMCTVKPVTAFLSTNLNNRNKTFIDIQNRILRQLGHPMINVELHRDQIFDAISIAIEFFTKYAGYTEEFLVLDSRIYEHDKGVRLDKICTIASNRAALEKNIRPELFKKDYDITIDVPSRVYVALRDIETDELPSNYDEPIHNLEVITAERYDDIVSYNPPLCAAFKINRNKEFTVEGDLIKGSVEKYENAFDYDLMDYRRVVEVITYDESSNKSLTSLFSFESALASQAYYTYQFSLRGFDLLSFHTLQEFLKTRDRVLALKRSFYFDPKTQYFTLSPQPSSTSGTFYGILGVRIEEPIRDIIDRIWIFKYALAQCKIMLGHIRGKFGSVSLAGGGSVNDNTRLIDAGTKEMEALEKELIEGTAYSEKKPAAFYVG